MKTNERVERDEMVKRGLVAGIAGGSAEIAFFVVTGALTNISAIKVARGISVSVGIDAFSPTMLSLLGIMIHMALAIGLGVAVAIGFHVLADRFLRGISVYTGVIVVLVVVWAFNFLILLPIINQSFVDLVPYPVSFASKLLFGLAAAEVLRRYAANDVRHRGGLPDRAVV